jgi:phosphatidylethanolamine-binding protein (PEBP) family uncharacterized protein
MRLTSSSFEAGGAIPSVFTCDGQDISPEFDWTYNIPAHVRHITADQPHTPKIAGLGIQGKNDAGKIGYVGPCHPLELTDICSVFLCCVPNLHWGPAQLATKSKRR